MALALALYIGFVKSLCAFGSNTCAILPFTVHGQKVFKLLTLSHATALSNEHTQKW